MAQVPQGPATRSKSQDEGRLAELGYKQELRRDWSLMHNFGITFGMAGLVATTASLKGFETSAAKTLGIYAALLFSHAMVNTFGVHILRYLNNTSIVLHSLGVFSFAVAVLAKAPKHQSAQFVFAKFYDGTGDPGWSVRASPAYVACIGVLIAQYTITDNMTSNSRMMFAFSRDRGIPHFFHKVDKRFRSPIRTVWLAATLSFLLAVPSLGSSVAFTAATSIATIGLYLSYGFPILIGLIWPRNFKHGPFDLGWFSRLVALIAVLWIVFITIVFCLPEQNPVNSQTLNYTPVAVGIVAAWSLGSWFLWARRWFTGPIRQIEAEAAGVDVDDPAAMEEAEKEGRIPDAMERREEANGEGEKSALAKMSGG
ncbi:MAG: hypothetical protein Q9227_008152 [Pyrenula ochraceoflavens]